MGAPDILTAIRARGVSLTLDGNNLIAKPKAAITEDLRTLIREHKPELLAALDGKINRWRVTHADDQITEHSSAGLTESEALELARCFGEPVRAEPVIAELPSPPANLDTILVEACHGVHGIDAATFRALLSPEDIEDIEGGYIPRVTLNAYARSFAEGIRTGRIRVIPRAALTSRVCCGECLHFERDTIPVSEYGAGGDGAGIGCCKIGGEGTGKGQPCLWPNAERECKDFEASITLPETL